MHTKLFVAALALVVGIGGSVAVATAAPTIAAMAPTVSSLARLATNPGALVDTTGRLADAAVAMAGATLGGELNPTAMDAAAARRILGKDGRFTVLLLGADARGTGLGGRTDAMMVASVDPLTRKAAIVSIPRDIVQFPISSTRRYAGKVNALYQSLPARTRGTTLRGIVGRALGIEIDAYVIVGFTAFKRLVAKVNGLTVTLAKPYYDPYYWVTRRKQGWRWPAGTHRLSATNALIFARSRKGDNDYGRARRQQQLVISAVGKVRSLGPGVMAALLAAGRGYYKTDLPMADRALIFAMVARADLSHVNRTVFGPSVYATWRYGAGYVLNLTRCKAWIRTYFPKARSYGIWLPPAPTPPSTPAPTPVASP
jgi:polyisoprenyl-teichoic acid--peptidoglycan teichoic acid transferase